METFEFVTKVELADADGIAIKEGSVLQRGNNTRGVVVWVGRKGGPEGPFGSGVGDIAVRHSGSSVLTVSNRYRYWRHVPHAEQTYYERLLSWEYHGYTHDAADGVDESEGRAIDGIMALLPRGIVDWDYGPYPDTLGDALRFLADYMEKLQPAKSNAEE